AARTDTAAWRLPPPCQHSARQNVCPSGKNVAADQNPRRRPSCQFGLTYGRDPSPHDRVKPEATASPVPSVAVNPQTISRLASGLRAAEDTSAHHKGKSDTSGPSSRTIRNRFRPPATINERPSGETAIWRTIRGGRDGGTHGFDCPLARFHTS